MEIPANWANSVFNHGDLTWTIGRTSADIKSGQAIAQTKKSDNHGSTTLEDINGVWHESIQATKAAQIKQTNQAR